jgi:lysophospholipid acyltransferase (LPLAT)-like uncharacterized protein
MLKSFLNSAPGRALQGWLIGWYVRLCGATTRWTEVNRAVIEAAWAAGGPVIVCFWHNRLLLVRRGWPPWAARQKLRILISQSRDGDVIAQACRTVGFEPVRGSSAKARKNKGVLAAFREMLGHLAKGGAIGVTPDGPRGPRMRAQMGAIDLARRSGAPIVGFAWSQPGRRVATKSWDHHVVPALFQRGAFVWGGPLAVPKQADEATLEAARLALETLLTDLANEADRLAGVPAIPAAEPARAAEPADA